MEVVQVAK